MLSVSNHNILNIFILQKVRATKTHHSWGDKSVSLSWTFLCQMKLEFDYQLKLFVWDNVVIYFSSIISCFVSALVICKQLENIKRQAKLGGIGFWIFQKHVIHALEWFHCKILAVAARKASNLQWMNSLFVESWMGCYWSCSIALLLVFVMCQEFSFVSWLFQSTLYCWDYIFSSLSLELSPSFFSIYHVRFCWLFGAVAWVSLRL